MRSWRPSGAARHVHVLILRVFHVVCLSRVLHQGGGSSGGFSNGRRFESSIAEVDEGHFYVCSSQTFESGVVCKWKACSHSREAPGKL